MKTVLAVTAALLLASAVPAQSSPKGKPAGCSCINCKCKEGQCPACPALEVATPAPESWRVVKTETRQECTGTFCQQVTYQWLEPFSDKQQHVLMRNGITIGGWRYDACYWQDYDAARGVWSSPRASSPLPVPGVENPPAKAPFDPYLVSFGDDPNNYGLDLEQLNKAEKRQTFTRNGREISRVEALAAVGQLPDDANTMKITWVGPAPTGERIREDIAASTWKGKVSYQSYPNLDEPLLRGKGFTTGLQVQAPGGRPLFCSESYDGPTTLTEGLTLAEERRQDQSFRPASWADARKPAAKPDQTPASPKDLITAYWPHALGALLLLLALRRRRTA